VKFVIDGIECAFIPVKLFRQQYNLPESFGVHQFEPKDFNGLAALDNAGAELNLLRQAMLEALPEHLAPVALLPFFDRLQQRFDELLNSINGKVGLKPEEIEFAVAGFGDVNQMLTYALIRAQKANLPLPDFGTLYHDWLSNSVRISSSVHEYEHRGQRWHVQVVHHVYGRVGLKIDTGTDKHFVQDSWLACPAEGYMLTLLEEIAARVIERLK
jgi:hypothetical protein